MFFYSSMKTRLKGESPSTSSFFDNKLKMVAYPLFNIIAKELFRSILGQEQMKNFVEKRVNSKTVGDPVPSLKVKKVNVKAADDKVITVNVDRDLFGRLLINANTRKINLKEVLRSELSPIPRALITFLL